MERTNRTNPRRGSFTLIELLVVIAVIAILMSILLPVVSRARKSVAGPIAYIGKDYRVHLVSPSGMDVDLAPADIADVGNHQAYLAWSPRGNRLALHANRPRYATSVVDVPGGKFNEFEDKRYIAFRGWQDGQHYLAETDGRPWRYLVRDADTGVVSNDVTLTNSMYMYLHPLPAFAEAHYLAIYLRPDNAQTCIGLVRKDLTAGRTIYSAHQSKQTPWPFARPDPMCEWAAWTHFPWTDGPTGVAFKPMREAAHVALTIVPVKAVGPEYRYLFFCDWTDDGNFLVNACKGEPHPSIAHGGDWHLLIIDRRGRLLREIETAVPPYPSSIAAWRRYLHQ